MMYVFQREPDIYNAIKSKVKKILQQEEERLRDIIQFIKYLKYIIFDANTARPFALSFYT
jgi:hypothetical protein